MRAEAVATSGMFRGAFAERRCLVPASAFYEWRPAPGGPKQPYAIARANGMPMAFRPPLGRLARTGRGGRAHPFVIITTYANADVMELHNRMPVILEPGDWPVWLGAVQGDPAALLHPPPAGMLRLWPVSRKVNSPRNNGAELLETVGDDAAAG